MMNLTRQILFIGSLFIGMGASAQKEETAIDNGLGSLYLLDDVETFMVSPENPTGQKGQGGMAIPDSSNPDLPFSKQAQHLGQGWKVRPFIKLKPGETVTIMDVDGPGIIQHIWMASQYELEGFGRNCVLRFYWDDEKTPSVEVPFTDFFAIGNEIVRPVNSLPVVVNGRSGMNCYWPMPFRKHAKVTFTNDDQEKGVDLLTFQITFAKTAISSKAAYFHAQWRRSAIDINNPEFVIADIKGKGKYVGTFMSYAQLHDGWFGEGEVKFFIDGDTKFPTINGTGTEDYFGASYGFPNVYSTPFTGNVLDNKTREDNKDNPNGPAKYSLYRWHIMDPVYFKKDLKITIQDLGWYKNKTRYRPLADDISTVAFWYQNEPHAPFPLLPKMFDRWPR